METIIIIKAVLALIFALSVFGKLTGETKAVFQEAGYSKIIMYATAIAELVFTVGLFTRFETFAAIGLLVIMGGAILTLVRLRVKPSKYTLAVITNILLVVLLLIQFPKAGNL